MNFKFQKKGDWVNMKDVATTDALIRIQSNGSDMTKPMVIDFFICVQNEQDGLNVANKATESGFKTSVEKDLDSDLWTCYCSIEIVPQYDNIISAECILLEIANLYGGWLDGFGSFGNAPE